MVFSYLQDLVVVGLSLFLISGCAPISSDMQSAKMVGKGGLEITVNKGSLDADLGESSGDENVEGGSFTDVQSNLGFHVAYGLNEKLDIRARYESIQLTNNPMLNLNPSDSESEPTPDFRMMSLGLKLNILPNQLSVYLPYTRYSVDDDSIETLELLQPTLLYTYLFKDAFEVTPSMKYLMPIGEEGEDMDPGYAYNLGLAYGLGNIVNDERLSKLTLRLESGRFYPITEDINGQYYTHTTFGLTYKLK